MNGSLKLIAPLVAALAIAACNAGGTSNVPATTGGPQVGSSASTNHVPEWQAKHQARAACGRGVDRPACLVLISNMVSPLCSPSSSCGFTATQLEAAYNLNSSLGNGSGTTVAVIEAGDAPNALSNVQTYRNEYNLGTANIFKYNQTGQQSNYPSSCADFGWCLETALDVEMVSASCPKCTIFLMEANSESGSDLGKTEAEAVSLGATILSNSWSYENTVDCDNTGESSYFATPGIAYLASTGDSGYNKIGCPSIFSNVIATGGTQLRVSGSTYSETVWDDAGGGCASPSVVGTPGIPKPSWQHDPKCAYRTDGDISSDSGCSPPVAEYDTDGGYSGWVGVCGTSVASPFLSGVLALAGNSSSQNGGENFWTLSKKLHKKDFHVITSGDDGACGIPSSYLCTAGLKKKKGGYLTYAAPVGWGTPNGISAF